MKTLKELKISPKKIELFNKINIFNSEDLLNYYPYRYESLTYQKYEDWKINDNVVFEATLVSYPKTARFAAKKSVSHFSVENDDDIFDITIFNRPWINNIKVGTKLVITGKYNGANKVTATNYYTKDINELLGIKPIYALKEGLTNNDFIKAIDKALNSDIDDFISDDFIEKYRLLRKKLCYRYIHRPNSDKEIELALRTLKYEEFLKFFLSIYYIRYNEKNDAGKKPKVFDVDRVYALANSLSFSLTSDQLKAINDIIADLQSNHIMYRLIQGDVGCGKTLVAAFGMYACCLSKHQCALLAPTEVLAKQHYHSLKELFRNQNINVEVLYSSLSTIKKKSILEDLKNGVIDCIIGTHSLIQDNVEFKNLGMVVTDEQQRFGVEQRKKLKEKGDKVDFLLMSATPIPRTLANTIYGDMDVSTIETMPANRKEVLTYLIKENSIRSIEDKIKKTINEHHQIYVICPAIEKNETMNTRNVYDIYTNLSKEFEGFCTVKMMHGKMSSEEKEDVIEQFQKQEIDILVSTTVIEVGVNIVNASMIIIYDANRFGLSQLHQLRGRVQRGSLQGECYLLTGSDDQSSIDRLNVLVECSDGFEISKHDLLLRGPGDILGTRQSGISGFILGNIYTDTKIIEQAKKDAVYILNSQDNKYDKMKQLIAIKNANGQFFID